jgi:hypothetical protein
MTPENQSLSAQAHERPSSANLRQRLSDGNGSTGGKPVGKRPYRYMGLDWSDPEMRRAYDREQQRKWREKNKHRGVTP